MLRAAEAPEDLATDGRSLFVADGDLRVLAPDGDAATRLSRDVRPARSPPWPACRGGGLAIALDGQRGAHRRRSASTAVAGMAGRRLGFTRVNALARRADGRAAGHRWLARSTRSAQWSHDLMEHGRSRPRVSSSTSDGARRRRRSPTGSRYAFGVCVGRRRRAGSARAGAHRRARRCRSRRRARGRLTVCPPIPSRLSPATGGGFWLACFAAAHPARRIRAARARPTASA